MRGLLIKDFYCMAKNCRLTFLIALLFTAMSLFISGNMFYMIYPAFLVGMIPTTVVAYDERDRWNDYAKTLPYSDTATVGSKYVTSIILAAVLSVLTLAANAVKDAIKSSFSGTLLLFGTVTVFAVTLIAASVNLPFIIRFGAAKGRIVAIVVSCIALGALSYFTMSINTESAGEAAAFVPDVPVSIMILLASAAVFALSYFIALALYKTKKE